MALTTPKDLRIAPCIAEISGVYKLPLGLKNMKDILARFTVPLLCSEQKQHTPQSFWRRALQGGAPQSLHEVSAREKERKAWKDQLCLTSCLCVPCSHSPFLINCARGKTARDERIAHLNIMTGAYCYFSWHLLIFLITYDHSSWLKDWVVSDEISPR